MTAHPLGLRPMEWKVICDCMWARSVCSTGNFLPAPRNMPAARRMVERGFLTQLSEEEKSFSPSAPEWSVFRISDENIKNYNCALDAAQKLQEEPPHVD